MATTRRTGGTSHLQLGRGVYGERISQYGPPSTGITNTEVVASGTTIVDDTALTLTAYTGDGRLTITVSAADPGAEMVVAGNDGGGTAQNETLDFSTQTTQTTTNLFVATGLSITPNDQFDNNQTVGVTVALASATPVPGLVQKRLPFTILTLDEDADQVQSESIVGGGSDTLNTTGQLGGAGRLESELLPEDAIHILYGVFNPSTLPTNTDLAAEEIRSAAAYTAGTAIAFAHDIGDPGYADWPGLVRATFAGATATAGANMVVRGYRKIGRPDRERFVETEVVPIATGALAGDIDTTKFFKQIIDVTINNVTGGTVALNFIPDTVYTDLTLNMANTRFEGWDFLMNKGGMPVTAYDVIPGNFELNIGNNIRIAVDLTASEVTNRRMLGTDAERDLERLTYDETLQSNASALSNFPLADLNFYAPWGSALTYGNDPEPTAIRSLTLGINHNYEPSEGYTGSRFRGEPIVSGDGIRQVTFSMETFFEHGTTPQDVFRKWQDLYRGNVTSSLELNTYNWLDSGRQYRIRFTKPRFQLTAVPTIPIEGRGQIFRRIEGKLVPSAGATTPDEVSVRIWSQNGFKED